MTDTRKLNKTLATILLVVLLGFVGYALLPFVNAFFGAFILYFLFRPFYGYLRRKGWKQNLAGSFVLVTVLLVVVIPLTFASTLLINEVGNLVSQRAVIAEQIDTVLEYIPGLDSIDLSSEQLGNVTTTISNFFFNMISSITKLIISLIVLFFVLFYLLTGADNLHKKLYTYLPFRKKNAERLVDEFQKVTKATIVSTGLIAIFQGCFLGLGFLIFGLPNPLFWGFLAVLISFLPVIGVPVIWIPTGLIQIFVQHNYVAGIGILIWGSIISGADNFTRPYIQRKVGEIHPLITVIGVFMGLPVFGLLGLFIGPLLLSYMLLITKMYIEEYI
ncbi:AI-2E family transporter [Candidatus Woesearchaeota archaeon]|nr:AI-2E family transporter [Candidatus Woesearchaeota archaeon]